MFGSSNNQDQSPVDDQPVGTPAPVASNLTSFTMDPPHHDDPINTSLPPEPTASPIGDAPTAPHIDDNPALPADNSPITVPTPPEEEPTPDTATNDASNADLIDIKQQALSQLSPIVNHLDQSPEDKFKTLMMMIQANDNQGLIKDAYEAAQQITDEKAKSQALLDVINEINYFTQKKPKD